MELYSHINDVMFTPSVIVPEQDKALTPDVFILNEYGKISDIRKDGKLIVNDEVRMSRIVDKLVPAFVKHDGIIVYGIYIKKNTVKVNTNGDLNFSLCPGLAVLDSRVIRLEQLINVSWIGFTSSVPAHLNDGRIVIYLYYHDQIPYAAPEGTPEIRNENQPYPRQEPYYPTKKYPDEQSGLNPMEIRWAYVDPSNNRFVGSPIPTTGSYAVITGSLWFHRDDEGDISVELKDNRSNFTADGEVYTQQGGGDQYVSRIDGGFIDRVKKSTSKQELGIYKLLDIEVDGSNKNFDLSKVPNSDVFVFVNGILTSDYIINGSKITIPSVSPRNHVYVFETIPPSAETGEFTKVHESKTSVKTYLLTIPGINLGDNLLIWVNGLLLPKKTYVINDKDQINFPSGITAGSNVFIARIVNSELMNEGIYQYYRDLANDTNKFFVYQINHRSIFVFYEGKLLFKNIDFIVKNDILMFKQILSSKNEIFILGV